MKLPEIQHQKQVRWVWCDEALLFAIVRSSINQISNIILQFITLNRISYHNIELNFTYLFYFIFSIAGIGIAECLIAHYVAFYYNVIIAWSLYYFIASFNKTLPWTSCDNSFNSPACYDGGNKTNLVNDETIARNISSATEYFEYVRFTFHNLLTRHRKKSNHNSEKPSLTPLVAKCNNQPGSGKFWNKKSTCEQRHSMKYYCHNIFHNYLVCLKIKVLSYCFIFF